MTLLAIGFLLGALTAWAGDRWRRSREIVVTWTDEDDRTEE